MNIRRSTVIGITAMVCALNAANAQFFANDLTDETSVLQQFNQNMGPDGIWGFSSNPTIQVYGADRTNITAGATIYDSVDYSVTTNDSDNVRSYLATQFGGYSTISWKAHVAIETPNVGDPNLNYLFVGLGNGIPNIDYYFEPSASDHARIRWHNGGNKNLELLLPSGTADSGPTVSSPGADFYLTYTAGNGRFKVEVDIWESDGTRFTGVDRTLNADISALGFTGDTEARIFFGGNSTATFSDFSVEEYIPTTPDTLLNVSATPSGPGAATVSWDADALSTSGYNVYRSLEAGTNYTQVATEQQETSYVDSGLTNGVTYYYQVAGVNDFGVGERSSELNATPTDLIVIGTENNNPERDIYKAFDDDVTTFYDLDAAGFVGLDYGAGNEQAILSLRYFLRNDSWANLAQGDTSRAIARSAGGIIQGANTEDFSDAEELWVLTTNAVMGAWNEVPIDNATEFRYVRLVSGPYNLYYMAELDFITAGDFTENGTPISWLTGYGLEEADDVVDNDLDGLLSWEEYVAGTDPTNSASVLMGNTVIGLGGDEYVVTWQSVEGKSYSLISNPNLVSGTPSVIATNIMGMAVETAYTTTVSGASSTFFEIGVD